MSSDDSQDSHFTDSRMRELVQQVISLQVTDEAGVVIGAGTNNTVVNQESDTSSDNEMATDHEEVSVTQAWIDDTNELIVGDNSSESIVRITNPPQILRALTQAVNVESLIEAFMYRYEEEREIGDLNTAIELQEFGVQHMPPNYDDGPHLLSNLSVSYLYRFEDAGDPLDLDKSIATGYKAASITPDSHPHRPRWLHNLGASLQSRFRLTGNSDDLKKAISVLQRSVDLAPGTHPDRLKYLKTLHRSLESNLERTGHVADIDKAITVGELVVSLTPEDDPDRAEQLASLGGFFQSRFEQTGSIVDVDQAISYHQRAINHTAPSSSNMSNRLNGLADSLGHRFQRSGDLADIERAITTQRQAVSLISDDGPDKCMFLTNLGNMLRFRYEQAQDPTDLEESVAVHQKAADHMPPTYHDRPGHLSNLGGSLHRLFEATRDSASLDQAISSHEQACALTPDAHPDKPIYLNNLGGSLIRRFEQTGEHVDADRSITALQQAVSLTPDGHPDKLARLRNLGGSFHIYFDKDGDLAKLEAAIESYRQSAASTTGKPSDRFGAAQLWAELLLEAASSLHPKLFDPLEPHGAIMELIPQLVWLGRTIHQRYQDMAVLGTAINEAVAAACEAGKYTLAVEWMEQGRTIIWGQILHLRTPVERLHDANPELAEQLRQVAQQLEDAGSKPAPLNGTTDARQESLEDTAQAHRRLALKWEELIKQTQSIPGFENFFRSKRLANFEAATHDRTIVMINVDSTRCDALILAPNADDVQHVPLQISLEVLQRAQGVVLNYLTCAGARERAARVVDRGSSRGGIANMLTKLWVDIVKPILDYLGFTYQGSRSRLPRLTWCVTGPLTFLPLHAAGDYCGTDAQSRIFNYVISSYTPSLTTLLESVQKGNSPQVSQSGLLAVLQASSVGLPNLPGALEEVNQLERLVKDHGLQRLDNVSATVEATSQAMERHGMVHFACHAVQDAEDPTRSGFILHDGRLELASIMKKQLKGARLAYLSACQTATGEKDLPDEAIHLAAGMLIAGYSSVIATMWSVRDDAAPCVAAAFYRHVLGEEQVGIADALHRAVADLRDKVGEEDFMTWAPFIHMGC